MRQRWITILCCLVCATTIHARHMFETGVRGGVSSMFINSEYGSMMPNCNVGLDVLYTYLSVNHVGIRAGIALDYSQSTFVAKQYSDAYQFTDPEGDVTKVKYSMDIWQERYNQLYASGLVQLAVDFQGWRFFAGPKFMFPLVMKYSEQAVGNDVSFTYPGYNISLQDDIYAFSLGKQDIPTREGNTIVKPKLWFVAALETGYAIPLVENQTIYVGAYANIGINRCIPPTSFNHAIELYGTAEGHQHPFQDKEDLPLTRHMNPVLESFNKIEGMPIIERFGYWDAGIKVAWQIYWGYKSHKYNRMCHCLEYDY